MKARQKTRKIRGVPETENKPLAKVGPSLPEPADCCSTEAELRESLAIPSDMDTDAVLERLWWVIDADPAAFFDERGNIKPIHELTEPQRKAIAHFEIAKENTRSGDGTTEWVHKVKWCDRLKAMELVMKYLGMLNDKPEPGKDIPVIVNVNFVDANKEKRHVH